jgi:hypothetical protein
MNITDVIPDIFALIIFAYYDLVLRSYDAMQLFM